MISLGSVRTLWPEGLKQLTIPLNASHHGFISALARGMMSLLLPYVLSSIILCFLLYFPILYFPPQILPYPTPLPFSPCGACANSHPARSSLKLFDSSGIGHGKPSKNQRMHRDCWSGKLIMAITFVDGADALNCLIRQRTCDKTTAAWISQGEFLRSAYGWKRLVWASVSLPLSYTTYGFNRRRWKMEKSTHNVSGDRL